MTDAAWEQVPLENYEDFWEPFDARFHFRRTQQRAIDEPSPSVTFDLAPIFASVPAQFAAAQQAVNAQALLAMTRAFGAAERLIVLDWQHPSWWFRPHQQAVKGDQRWPVEVFPDGDYYAFLTQDLNSGTFGHPWDQTLCVFGALMRDLVPMLGAWLPVKRGQR